MNRRPMNIRLIYPNGRGFLTPSSSRVVVMNNPILIDPSNIPTLPKNGSITKKEVMRWHVDINALQKPSSTVRSDFFGFSPCPNFKFCLVAYSSDTHSCFTVSLFRFPLRSNATDSSLLKVGLALLDVRDRCHHAVERVFRDNQNVSVQVSFDSSCLTAPNHLMFVQNGQFRVFCSLDVDEVICEKENNNPKLSGVGFFTDISLIQDLSDDLFKLLNGTTLADVTLNIDQRQFLAHKAILSARSSVFAAMFHHETLEKAQNSVTIEDISYETMHHLLKFIYSGKISELNANEVVPLYSAADKYDLPKLKENCSSILCSNLSTEIALSVLIIAHFHEDENLKTAAIDAILNDPMEVMRSAEWLCFMKEHSELANTIVLNLAMRSTGLSDK